MSVICSNVAQFLFDNGSLRPEATFSLRRIAQNLSGHIGKPVEGVSLLHSQKIPADQLGGEPARLLESALVDHFTRFPDGEAVLAPLFFGPSAALTEYVPARLAVVRKRFPQARVRMAPCLVDVADVADLRLAMILADQVRCVMKARQWTAPRVILVDHGTPQFAVTQVRNLLGHQLKSVLTDEVGALAVASMERREGRDYDFNEPLLATALRTPPFCAGEVVIALQFLSPGRHAGPGGDIAEICAAAEADCPELRTQMTEPIAGDLRLLELLAERMNQAVEV